MKSGSYLIEATSAGTLEQCHYALAMIRDLMCAEDGLSEDGVTGLGFFIGHVDRSMEHAAQQAREERQALQLRVDELEAFKRDPDALAQALVVAKAERQQKKKVARARAQALQVVEGLTVN